MTLDPDGDLCFMTHQTSLPCGQNCIKHFCSRDVHSKMLFFQGSSSSFGDVCIAITTATRKDESQNRKTKSKPLAEAWMGSEIVKPGMGF